MSNKIDREMEEALGWHAECRHAYLQGYADGYAECRNLGDDLPKQVFLRPGKVARHPPREIKDDE